MNPDDFEKKMQAFKQDAKSQGYTDEQISAEEMRVRSNYQNKQAQSTMTSTPTTSPDLWETIGQGAIDVGKSLAAPFVRTGQNILSAVTTIPQAAAATILSKFDPQKAAELAGMDIMGTQTTAKNIVENPKKAIVRAVKDIPQIASWGIPFGKGANIFTKALIPGMAVGGLQSLGEDQVTPGAVAKGVILGGLGSSVIYTGGAILNKLAGGVERAGTKLIQAQYNLPRSIAEKVSLPDTVAKLNEYGVANINDVKKVAEKVTGNDGIITKMTRDAVAGAQNIDTAGLRDLAKGLASDPSIPPGQDTKLVNYLTKGIQKMLGRKGFAEGANPLDAFDFAKDLESKAAGITRGRNPSMIPQQDKAMAQAYQFFADEIKDRIFISGGADNVVLDLTKNPKYMQQLYNISPKLAQDVSQATTVGELRSVAAPFVRGSIAAHVTETGQELATETAAGAVKGMGKFVQHPTNILAIPLSSDTVSSKFGSFTANLGKAIDKAQVSPSLVTATGQLISRLPTVSGGSIEAGGQSLPATPPKTLKGPNEPITYDYPINNLLADIQRDPKNKSYYESIYNIIQKQKTVSTKQQEVTDSENLIAGFEDLKTSVGANIVDALNPASRTGQYLTTKNQVLTQLLAKMIERNRISDQDRKFYLKQTQPSLLDAMIPGRYEARVNGVIDALRAKMGIYSNSLQNTTTQELPATPDQVQL